ncbi:hypothetical protein DEA8626_02447 [Defluviimonas aquaemixtae]|uniref:Lipoprotein n=1 Tax=Albidovulum aquaemixtae TaxID=1542388 RepID=A0A2R8BJ32_9RHOB|nr:hypothetical protein [Defluviimonas aquaemixtae]SPH23383.1 hypothetical protein DEA8626_02447 [Defluviimonas aquaemixtae]
MKRLGLSLVVTLTLAGCGAERVWAPDEAVARARYVSGESPSITLYTVERRDNGTGEHSGLMIDGSQRVMFDPAGTWHHPWVPERNDLHYGITEQMRKFYIDYHARETYDVIEYKIPVSPEVAELAIRRAESYGAVNKAFCGVSVSHVLKDLPGFEDVPRTFFPNRITKAIADKPGVTRRVHQDGDPDNNHGVLLVQKDAVIAPPNVK